MSIVATARFLSAHPLYTSPRFQLCEESFATSDGEVVRPVIHHPGAVAVIAQPDKDSVVLVRQFRYPVRRWTLEIPAGTRVPGEPAEVSAARELAEEAGFRAQHLQEVLRFHPALGISDEELILYRASGLTQVPAAPEHGELIEGLVVRLDHLSALLATGELCDAKTLIALAMLGIPLGAASTSLGTRP